MTPAERMAVAFARILRGAGLKVPTGSVLTFVDALGALGIDDRERVYWAGRATLVRHPEDIALFDETFVAFWTDLSTTLAAAVPVETMTVSLAIDDEGQNGSPPPTDPTPNDEPTSALR